MSQYTPLSYKRFKVLLVVLWLLVTSGLVSPFNGAFTDVISNHTPITIIEDQISLFGGVNSVRAVIGSSTIGVCYGTSSNPQPLTLFTSFSQNIAKIELKNRQGTPINRTQLNIRNSFLVSLNSIIEFNDYNEDNISSPIELRRPYRLVNLSQIQFDIEKTGYGPNTTSGELHYSLQFSAENVSYTHLFGTPSSDTVGKLVFKFDLYLKKDRVNIESIPIISIQPVNRQLQISIDNENLTSPANRFTPRLKFSCNISGWDYASPKSKLLLMVNSYTYEDIQPLGSLLGYSIDINTLKKTNLLSSIGFIARQSGINTSYDMDLNDRQRINLTSYRFLNNQISIRNSIRNFLNFTWSPNIDVDGTSHPIEFQLFLSDEKKLNLGYSAQISTIFLLGGFVFPQGTELHYDPEVQLEELKPIFEFVAIPNRLLLEQSSFIILISGFFIGILIIYRQRTK